MLRLAGSALVCLLAGCGLTLDVDPPDRPWPHDAAVMDAGLRDAGAREDASEPLDAPPEPVCGNGIVEPGERCDDGNTDAGDGCTPNCTFDCSRDEDCGDPGDLCRTGTECDVAAHRCRPRGAIVCPERDACERLVGCHPGVGCVYEPLEEICDGFDQDCDGVTDEGSGTACAADLDEDGYGDPGDVVWTCDPSCPEGYVSNQDDCWDGPRAAPGDPPGPQLASPDQPNYFREPRGDGTGSFDWSCDGVEEPLWGRVYDGTCDIDRGPCEDQAGWAGPDVAGCNERAAYVGCRAAFGGVCEAVMRMETQACR